MNDFVTIDLVGDKKSIIDREDLARVSQFTWRAVKQCRTWYAVTRVGRKEIKLHRFIMKVAPDAVIDHRNRDGLDNRKENLRPCTRGQNRCNAIGWPETRRSKYKGLSLNKGRWQARIKINRRTICLGTYADEVEAAKAYDAAAKKFHGEFARLNFGQE